MVVLEGKGVSNGIAFGKIYFYARRKHEIFNSGVLKPEEEKKRFEQAKEIVLLELDSLYHKALLEAGEDSAQIFEIHQMMLRDEDFLESINSILSFQSASAEYAVSVTRDKFASLFSSMDDIYMKERAADIIDISNSLLAALSGDQTSMLDLGSNVILAADDFSPSETVQMDKSKISALVTKFGSSNSHTAILARTMNIPALIGMGETLNQKYNGENAIVDGFSGKIYIEPDKETENTLKKRYDEEREKKCRIQLLKGQNNVTVNGQSIRLCTNIACPGDVKSEEITDSDGIGLFRSEFLYMESQDYPTEEEQFEAYKTVAEAMQGKPVIIRTLDIGADKQADYFDLPKEENPAMGLRAIRICLSRVDVFKTQLRAIYRASAFGRIEILFPMITSLEEVAEIKKILKEVKQELKEKQSSFSEEVPIGIMIETPAAAVISDLLAKEVDFFSIGTNDLTQYTLAADRQNRMIEAFYDPHHPAVLRLIKTVVENAHQNGIWAGICGELGADLELTETFLAMGVDELSVTPSALLEIRQKVRQTNVSTVNNSIIL